MFPDRSHLCIPLARSLDCTATLDAVAAGVPMLPNGPHAPTTNNTKAAIRTLGMRPTVRDELRTTSLAARPGSPLVNSSAHFRRAPCGRLEEDRPASGQQPMQRALDPLSHVLGELEHNARVVGRVSAEMRNIDRFAECDEPLRRQWKQTRKAQQWKRRRDRCRRPPEQSSEWPDLEHHGVHLF